MDSSIEELETTYLFHMDEEDRHFQRWESIFGLVWSKEDVESMFGGETDGKTPIKKVAHDKSLKYPLSLLIRPELSSELMKRFGLAPEEEGGKPDAESLFGVGKEEFIRRTGMRNRSDELDSVSSNAENNKNLNSQPFKSAPQPYRLGNR